MCKDNPTRLTHELVFNTMAEGVIHLDTEGNVVRVNNAAAEIIGFKREVFEELNVYQPPRGLGLFDANMNPLRGDQLAGARALRERQPVRDLLAAVKRPGRDLRWILLNGYPIFDGGRLIGAASVFLEVTQLHEIMTRLRRAERHNSAIIDALTVAMANAPAIIEDEIRIEALSRREREVLVLLAGGLDNQAIADKLGVQRSTIRSHLATIEEKLGVENEREAILVALRARLVNLYE